MTVITKQGIRSTLRAGSIRANQVCQPPTDPGVFSSYRVSTAKAIHQFRGIIMAEFYSFDFSLVGGGTMRWETIAEFEQWLKNEYNFWSFLKDSLSPQQAMGGNGPDAKSIYNENIALFEEFIRATAAMKTQNTPNVSQFNSYLTRIYIQKMIPLSTSAVALAIKSLGNPLKSAYALQSVTLPPGGIGHEHPLTRKSAIELQIKLSSGSERADIEFQTIALLKSEAMESINLVKLDAASLRNQMANIITEANDANAKERKKAIELSQEYSEKFASAEKAIKESLVAVNNSSVEIITANTGTSNANIAKYEKEIKARIDALEVSLTTKHVLANARKYWSDVHIESRNAAITAKKAMNGYLRWAFPILASASAIVMYLIIKYTADGFKNTWAAYSFIIISATGVIWVARILVRDYLSLKHREVDAREREVMILTYSALLAEDKKLDRDDKQIILSSIFRPSATGYVKDDMAPQMSPAAIISRGSESSGSGG
jgi:hypothetical protein